MSVYVLYYNHGHGVDLTVYSRGEDAWKAATEIVDEYRDEFDVPSGISSRNAAEKWWELTNGTEHTEVRRCHVISPQDMPCRHVVSPPDMW